MHWNHEVGDVGLESGSRFDDLGPVRVVVMEGSFFRRMRILAAGQLVEDIDQYNRIHEMMQFFVAKESRLNDGAEAFGEGWVQYDDNDNDYTQFKGISGGQGITVLFKPLSGLLNQNKMLPIRYAPITIELELVDNMTDPIYSTYLTYASGTTPPETDIVAAKNSLLWNINNVQVKVDMCTLDNALDNSYALHLLSGKSLPISYNTFVSQMQTIAGQDKPLINVSRALTRLKGVFVTLLKDFTGTRATLTHRKPWNDFFSPMHVDNKGGVYTHNSDGEFEFQLQIGSKLFPEYPIRSHNEAYYQLKKCLGVQASSVHNFDITGTQYRDNKFVLGTDCEKVLDAGFTGLNTRAGDLMSVSLKYNNNTATRLADRIHIVLHSDQILEIRDSGCQVFD